MDETEAAQADPRVVKRFGVFAAGAGAGAAAVAALVLVGWALDVALLKSVLPGHVDMKVNAAVALLTTGVALICCRSPSSGMRTFSGVLSTVVMVIGGVTLAQYLFGFDAGIDLLWVDDPVARALGRPPGRMSQLSSLGLLLVGAIGVATSQLRWVAAAQAMALVVIAIALYALSTFGYVGWSTDGRNPFNPVALHTAALLLLLALGWLAARPEAGMMRVLSARSFGGTLSRRALLPAIMVPTALSYVAQSLQMRSLLSPEGTITLLAVASGGLVAWIIWSVSELLDRVEREQRVTSHLREDASTDPLTALANRRAFQVAIEGLLRRRREQDAVFSLLMLDLDRFKGYNDAYGHVAGDQALRLVGHLLAAALRPGDIAARYGGEEFAVLLPGIDGDRARLVAERIRLDFLDAPWPHQAMTASIGVAQAQAVDDEESLVARADRALYAAKASGRNRVVTDSTLNLPDEPAPLQPQLL